MSLCFSPLPGEDSHADSTLLLDVQDVGAWVVKFRRNVAGAIVNNRDLVDMDLIDVQASLHCGASGFWQVVNGGIRVQDAVNSKLIKITGS